jgi:hypothetical protein
MHRRTSLVSQPLSVSVSDSKNSNRKHRPIDRPAHRSGTPCDLCAVIVLVLVRCVNRVACSSTPTAMAHGIAAWSLPGHLRGPARASRLARIASTTNKARSKC